MLGGKSCQWGKLGFFQDIDAIGHVTVASLPTPLPGDGFVVASDIRNDASVIGMELHPPGNFTGNSTADGIDGSGSVGIHGVRHEDDVGVAGLVDPERGSGEPGMAEGADWEQLAPVARVR